MKKKYTQKKEIKCAYCGGKGLDPFGSLRPATKCQVCVGSGRISITIFEDKKLVKCQYCRGTGRHPFTRMTCTSCKGKGALLVNKKAGKVCPDCQGSGATAQKNLPCRRCDGSGMI